MTGFCSNCHKVWTLKTGQGVCQWCGKLTTCQTTRTIALRSIKSSRKPRQRQAQSNGNSYDRLADQSGWKRAPGGFVWATAHWTTYYKVASQFSQGAKVEDREDLLHDIILTLATVERNNGHKPFTEAAMYRVASRTVADYWRTQYKLTNGLDCGSCSQTQRQKCRSDWLYSECPKAIKLEYLHKPITDDEGNITELGELIADDHAIDLDAWLDNKTFLAGCPQRLIAIAHKRLAGIPLDNKEDCYLRRFRQREQKRLF